MAVEPFFSQSAHPATEVSTGPTETHVVDILENIAYGILLINTQGHRIYANAYAHWINHQLAVAESQSEGIASVIWKVCQEFVEVCDRAQNSTLTSNSVLQTNPFPRLRLRVKWLPLETLSEPLLMVILEDQHQTAQQAALIEAKRYRFTPRETEVWLLRSKEYSYRQIAQELFIGLNTVKRHLKSIYAKRKAA